MYEEWIGKKAKLQVCLMYRDLSRKFGWWKLWEPGQEVWNKENVTIILDMVTLKPEYSNLWSIQCNEGGLS